MREIDRQPRIDFDNIPMGQLVHWLDRLVPWQSLGLVLGSTVMVVGLDFLAVYYDMRLATLYIIPISLAGWVLRARYAIALTIALTLIASGRPLLLEAIGHMALVNGLIRTTAFGLLIMIVLGFRRTYDYSRLVASRDRMTGALNKVAFQQRVQRLLDTANDARNTVLLVCLDLDGFKAINDRHGHHAGDRVLEIFAAGAAQALRRGDCFGRLGGDEFAVAMLSDPGKEARRLAEDLHMRFSSALRDTGYPVTCSMGALEISHDGGVALDELMRCADRLQYVAKNAGKDCLRFETIASTCPGETRSSFSMPMADEQVWLGGA